MNSNLIYDMFRVVENARGNSKFQYLRDEMKPYLKWAYDPYRKFYLTKCAEGKGAKVFTKETSTILKALTNRIISGNSAQHIVNQHTRKMSPKSALLFGMILKKDLRIGMGAKTINKKYPGLIPTHDVMLAKLYDLNRIKFPCFAGLKIDCVRAIYHPETNKFYSRGGHEYFGLSHITNALKQNGINFPIDVELAVKGGKFQWSSGQIRNHNETPQAVAHLIELPASKASFRERLNIMSMLAKDIESLIEIPHKIVYNDESVIKLFKQARKAGYEGLVLRSINYDYKNNRSWDWQKVKNIIDLDLEVLDVYEGQGKYKGQLGGVVVKYDYPNQDKIPSGFNKAGQKVGGGFSDYQRKFFWNNLDEIIGKTIQVIITEFTDDGNFRHSRMGEKGIRDGY